MEVGLCGKIPSRGDFLANGLAVDFVDSWNEWLQAVMAVSREQLGANWLETYLTSPIWHFALSAGVCGKDAMLGCLMPSVDQVGRHFPFTLARPLNTTPVHARQSMHWSDTMQQQILKPLDDDFVFEPWLAQLNSADWQWPADLQVSAPQLSGTQSRPAWVLSTATLPDPSSLLHHSYRQLFGRYCVWWTEGSELVPACTLVSSGLPQVSQYAAMLSGEWQRWGWLNADIQIAGAA